MSDISSIKLPDNSSYNIKAKKIFYAECSTARNVVAKVVACSNFVLEPGAMVAIRFTDTTTTAPTSGNITLNINNTGAKNIVPKGNNSVYSYGWNWAFCNNQTWLFMYNGTYFVCMNQDNNTDTKVTSVGNHYTPAKSTTKSASGGTVTDITNSTSGTQVVTGVEMDAKGHVTGVTSVALKSTDTQVTVDSALSGTSTNPVQNKVINSALAGKAAASHSHTISQISDFPASLPANGGNADTVDGFHASSLFCQRATPSSKDCNDCTEVGAYFFNGCLANAPTSNGVLNSGTYFILESVMNNAAVIQTATFTHGTFRGKKFSRHLDMTSNSWSAWDEIMKNQYATGLISGLSNGSAVTVSLKFAPVAVLFFDSTYIKPVSSGFSVSLGTGTFTITPSSVSAMGTTGVRYLAFGG